MRHSNRLDTSVVNQTTKMTKPKLSLVWVKTIDESNRERLVGVWTLQD
jgi:hypothetical protein